MSTGDPRELPPLPGGYHPGDRVRIREGMFANTAGEVLGPAPDCPLQPAVHVRLRIWGRDVDVGLAVRFIEPVPPG